MESPILKIDKDKPPKTAQIDTEKNDDAKKYFSSVTTIEITESNDGNYPDDIVILRRDPTTNRNFINKSAYAKLHRTLSPTSNNTIDNLKDLYENKQPDLLDLKSDPKQTTKTEPIKSEQQIYTSKRTTPVKLDEETVQSLKTKYSPGSFGYPRAQNASKLPVAKPRTVKSQIIFPSTKQPDKNRLRYSLDVGKKPKSKDENSNELCRKNSSSSGEFITIITRSESEASVDRFEKELNLFTMEGKPREKKKSGFKKIFSGRIFGRDKKKKEEEKSKLRESGASSDNFRNETNSFNRQSNYRHTVDGSGSHNKQHEVKVTRSESERFNQPKKVYITKDMEEKYAEMHINQFNHIKQTFEEPEQVPQGYVRMNKPIVKNNPGPISYMNLPNVKKYIDTSSSASTLESDKSSVYQIKDQKLLGTLDKRIEASNATSMLRFETNDGSRDTPPRAQELRQAQGVRLVNPKALIPINSERALPNPYQNSDNVFSDKAKAISTDDVFKDKSLPQPQFEETYGTVFDSLQYDKKRPPLKPDLQPIQKPPRSPSLESSKLKLPPNREIVPLSPRMKSPIPHDNVSTEKIIATGLLKPTKSPPSPRRNTLRLPSPSRQVVDIDYTDNVNNSKRNDNIASKPPISKIPFRRFPETKPRPSNRSLSFDTERLSQTSPLSENNYPKFRNSQATPFDNQDKITTDVMVHNAGARTPTPNSLLHNRSLSPMRPQSVRSSTPVDASTSPKSPQKDDMRKSVEAYYWKEIKKLKEQENYDLYLYQMQMNPYGYAEEPVSVRRSRSLSPTTHRNSRRSLSLPREPRSSKELAAENPYGRMQHHSIPEGRAVVNPQQSQQRFVIYGQMQDYQSNFNRNAPERRTIDGTPRGHNSLYKPIFKRGSLTTPVQEYQDDLQNKKVSFSSSRPNNVQSLNSWPTKNGFTQSPPQRRIDNNRRNTLEDDVFLPATPRTQSFDDYEVYGYANKPVYEYRPMPNDVYQRTNQNEPIYGQTPNVRYRQEYGAPGDERIYGDDLDTQSAILRPSSVLTVQEPLYSKNQVISRRMSYDNANLMAQRRVQEPQYVARQLQRDPRYGYKREIIVTDEIFGQFGGYIPQSPNEQRYLQQRQNPVYSSRQSIAEPVYGRNNAKQVSVRDKVCDMYGQIHDRDSPSLASPNQITRTGVMLGELQRSPGSPQVIRQSYSHLPNEHFARNSRLTASANDMYRRYQGTDPRYRSDLVYGGGGGGGGGTRYAYQDSVAPTRPLPPVPVEKKVVLRNNAGRSDTESVSDVSDMQKITSSGAKNKKRSFFGK